RGGGGGARARRRGGAGGRGTRPGPGVGDRAAGQGHGGGRDRGGGRPARRRDRRARAGRPRVGPAGPHVPRLEPLPGPRRAATLFPSCAGSSATWGPTTPSPWSWKGFAGSNIAGTTRRA